MTYLHRFKRKSNSNDKNKKIFKLKFFNSKKTSYLLLFFTFFFFILCGFILFETRNSMYIRFDYSHCEPINQTLNSTHQTSDQISNRTFDKASKKTCLYEFQLKEDRTDMIYIHYHMIDFYKNFYTLLESYSKKQVMGDFSLEMFNDCNFLTQSTLIDFNRTCALAPCGELANFMFNDTFRIYYLLNDENKTRIPVEIDHNDLSDHYHSMNFNNPDYKLIDLIKNHTEKPRNWKKSIFELDENDSSNNGFRNQRFIVWMFTSHFPDFSKLYGKLKLNLNEILKKQLNKTINESNKLAHLIKGDYILEIDYNYPLWSINSKKKVSISSLSSFGQDNIDFKIIIFTALIVSFLSMILVYLIYRLHDERYRLYINDNSDFEFVF